MSIGVAYIASDVNRLDYCFEASVRSLTRMADQISICTSRTGDGTLDLIEQLRNEYGKDRFILNVDDWKYDRQFQKVYRTKAMQALTTDWVVMVDADEVFHQSEIDKILVMSRTTSCSKINFKVNHYYGLPHWIHKHPKWYERHTRMWRRTLAPVCNESKRGSVCILECDRDDGSTPLMADVTIHHYGHTRDALVMGQKNIRFNGWYTNNQKTMDGSLPGAPNFEYGIPELGHNNKYFVKAALDLHPKVVLPWLRKEKFIRWLGSGNERNRTNYQVYNPVVGRNEV
jgi:hypothetical protein